VRASVHGAIGISGAAVLGTALLWVACGGGGDDAAGSGGTDAAAEGGGGGTGGAAPGGGGSGGTGSSGADSGWGAAPKWESTGQQAAGCAIDFLANASEITALTWKPCAWSAECEEAVFNPALVGSDPGFSGDARDDGKSARLSLSFLFSNVVTLALGADGALVAALRTTSAKDCWLTQSSLSATTLGVAVARVAEHDFGGVLLGLTAGAAAPKAFTLVNPPPGTPQRFPLGESRWLWFWAPVERFSTVSAVDGSDFTMFAKATGETAMLAGPVAAGNIFLFDEWVVFDGGTWQRRISWSDGKLPPAPYLTPTVTADDFGFAAFANSHLGFMRGINRKDINKYDSVEVWSSPFSADPKQLQPAFLAKLPFTGTPELSGGHGVVASLSQIGGSGEHQFTAWNVTTKATRSLTLPNDRVYKAHLGVTRHHVFLAAAKPGMGPSSYLIRYPVP